uniref:Innexin n=1 Tax=Panagrolaimus sp. JU765 TaxID=591449 RepID=A0AC34QWP8_9BILA
MFPALEKVVKNFKPKYDDDSIDRFNYALTTKFLSLLIVIIGMKQYIGEPLQCWMAPEFKGNWEKYIESYCFVENTYYWPVNEPNIPLPSEKKERELIYYQWVPIVLIGQLLLFLAPKAIWAAFSWKTGFNVRAMTGGNPKKRETKVLRHYKKNDCHDDATTIAFHIKIVADHNSNRNDQLFGVLPTKFYENYTTTVYLVFKLLNCVNVIGQLFVLNHFLNTNYTFWGFGILRDLLTGRDWTASGHFPRVTYCDFMRREDVSSVPMQFTVQCVLMINMFNEKIYVTYCDFMRREDVSSVPMQFTVQCVLMINMFNEKIYTFAGQKFPEKLVKTFIEDLPTDAMTMLRLTSTNAGDLISSDIVFELFKIHFHKEKTNLDMDNFERDHVEKIHSKKHENVQHQISATTPSPTIVDTYPSLVSPGQLPEKHAPTDIPTFDSDLSSHEILDEK